ncbi:MAG: aminotransferase class V-fold PLP-dependent enzyme [Caldisericia bacterium]|nr:aminotransferase class V-fold PLP-dependent enzyme [Caldisericia bacterium]
MEYKKEFPSAAGIHNLDSAATGLLPKDVIEEVSKYWHESCCNAGRSAYFRSIKVVDKVESARENISQYFGATPSQLLFAPGATHSINWVARGLNLKKDDIVLVTEADHHANVLPWLQLKKNGIKVRWVECDNYGRIDTSDFAKKIIDCKIATFSGASNVSGAIQPIKELSSIARNAGVMSLVDAAQLAPHEMIDFTDIGCDFMAISGHKMMSPKGVGILLASSNGQKSLSPVIVGGGAVKDVTMDGFELQPYPKGFESGTQSIEGIIGLASAVGWYLTKNQQHIYDHENKIAEKIFQFLKSTNLKVVHPSNSTPTIAFTSKNIKPHLIASHLDNRAKILVRSGHMCALPFVRKVSSNGFVRVSVGPWNNMTDADIFIETLSKYLNEN